MSEFTLIAGPCTVETRRQTLVTADCVAAGRRELVRPLSLAAVAAGADGLIVGVHPDPSNALCDGPQALTTAEFAAYADDVPALARAVEPALA